MGRRPRRELAPDQLVRVIEVLRQAEAMVERLSHEVVIKRGVVKMPREGYPLDLVQRDAIVQALDWAHWVQADAARMLGITPRVLGYKVRQYGIRPPRGHPHKWKPF